jgi:hydantoinase/carbamoylase family amidase
MREAGLEISRDDAGNLFGKRGSARVWAGSHLDSVPTGGRFDGALGVVAAIEAAARLPGAELAVVVFRAEETGPMGSRKLTELPDAFLEVHVEQGPVLALAGEPLGVVTAIAGQARGYKVFEGRADHAGTTPMDARADALVEAAQFVLHVRACAEAGTVATVGAIWVEPNATNVVPEKVTVSVDARSADAALLDALVERIGFELQWKSDPAPMSDAFAAVLPAAPRLVSGAGHDAMVLAAAGVPSSMLFVRSLNGGISHHPDELSSAEDIALAVDALTAALSRLAS